MDKFVALSLQNKQLLKNAMLDKRLVILRTAGHMPGRFIGKWLFREAFQEADPKYIMPTRNRMEDILIPGELAVVVQKQETWLGQQ